MTKNEGSGLSISKNPARAAALLGITNISHGGAKTNHGDLLATRVRVDNWLVRNGGFDKSPPERNLHVCEIHSVHV
jgi:hypothetical protein